VSATLPSYQKRPVRGYGAEVMGAFRPSRGLWGRAAAYAGGFRGVVPPG